MHRLEEIKRTGGHTFPGTIARYVAGSETHPDRIQIVLIWRSTVMPDETERKRTLEELRQALADILDWSTAQYDNGEVFMHT